MNDSTNQFERRLQKELCISLRDATQRREILHAKTLVAVGARIDWLPYSIKQSLQALLDNPESMAPLFSANRSKPANIRLKRTWTAEEAYTFAYNRWLSDAPNPQCLAIAACRGWVAAQHDIAVLFEEGIVITENLMLAVAWYRKAATAGDAYAQNNLGTCFAKGKGVPFDGNAAVSCYRKSANQGCMEGMENYAFCLLCGECTKRREKVAYRLAMRSFLTSQSGRSAFIVGQCIRHGWGTPKDGLLAKAWLDFAAAKGCTWKTSGWKGCAPGRLPKMKKK